MLRCKTIFLLNLFFFFFTAPHSAFETLIYFTEVIPVRAAAHLPPHTLLNDECCSGAVYFGMFSSMCVCVCALLLADLKLARAKHHIHHFLVCTFLGHLTLVMFVVALREI